MASGLSNIHSGSSGDALKEGLQSFVSQTSTRTPTTVAGTPAAGVFYSTITGRAPIVDISKDLKVSMGIERIMIQRPILLQNEFGPNGEQVSGILNDDRGLIRLVGTSGSATNLAYGPYINISTAADYFEVTFYGTGLNALILAYTTQDARVSVDGGAEGSNVLVPYANVLGNRNYAMNCPVVMASGLALGVHTVKIRAGTASGLDFCGFEIINSSATLSVNPGTAYIDAQKVTLSTAQSLAFNSTFESGTLAARGGRVLTYLKQDGTVGKAVQAVNAAQANLTAADHTNEEVARTYFPREFGASRQSPADDFSTLSSSASSRAFTLDDGTTTLNGINLVIVQNNGKESVICNNAGDYLIFTFVGTGIDVELSGDSASTRTFTVSIDGSASVGTVTIPTNKIITQKIASGLPYGTHTVRLTGLLAGSGSLYISALKTYQPKKPALPSGAVELADYNVMATYVGTTVVGSDIGAAGVLRKAAAREFVYSGTWVTPAIDTGFASGFNIGTISVGSYFEYTFFGTGVEIRTYFQPTVNSTISIDGSSNLSAFTTGIVTASAVTLTAATGLVSGTGNGAYGNVIKVSGLSLGLHKVRITQNTTASAIYADALDIITPIHSAKSNLVADLQNTLAVGSQGISDNRQASMIKSSDRPKKNWSQAIGLATVTTTSTAYVPAPDMSVVINCAQTGKLDISFEGTVLCSATNGYADFAVYVDGSQVGGNFIVQNATANADMPLTLRRIIPVSAGVHKVDIYWKTPSGASVALYVDANASRTLNVLES